MDFGVYIGMVFFIKLLAIFLLGGVAYANTMGTLSVFVFKDGKALRSSAIVVDGRDKFANDIDGLAKINLSVGTHQVEILGRDENGINLGYFKKSVTIKEARDTQLISIFYNDTSTPTIEIDTPVGKLIQDKSKKKKATGVGKISGVVLSSDNKKPIEGARVFVKGTSVDARTDASGRFVVSVPAGVVLSISVVHSAYSSQTVNGIKVAPNGVTSRKISLTPASMELEEFVVLAPSVEGSLTDIIAEEKNTNAIANIIGSEEFSKKGDSSAASALKRVTGVTLIGGKSIFVRGLGERYSNVELNSLPLPSPDPTKRVVPLDIFPSSMIGSMKIQKSGTPDIPANFGGGYIDMRTKDINSDDEYIKIKFGIKANSNTGKSVLSHIGSDSDWSGYDNGYRDIPQDVLDYSSVKVGESLNDFSRADLGNGDKKIGEARFIEMTKAYAQRNYGTFMESLPIGGSFALEWLKSYEYNNDHKITIFANYNYSQEHTYKEENFSKYRYDIDSKPVSKISDGSQIINRSKYSQGAMLNIGYLFSDVWKIKYTKLYTHVGEKNTRETEGVFGSNFDYQYYTYLDWSERTLDTDQLTSSFDYQLFDIKNTFNFGIEYATATLHQPNNFLYQDIRRGESESEYQRVYSTVSQNFLAKKIESEDKVFAFNLSNKIEYGFFSPEDYMLFGVSFSEKNRKSQYQRFYLNRNGGHGIDDYTSLAGGDPEALLDAYVRGVDDYANFPFLINSLFDPSDYYDAKVTQTDMFFSMLAKPYKNLEIMVGLRYVKLNQVLSEYVEDDENDKKITLNKPSLEINDLFPSMSIKYKYDKKNIFDLAFSKTFIIPDLREFSSGSYFHPYDVANVHGNPDLNNTIIYSVDLKYSHYFSDDEYLKVGLFYKYLDKPIEDTQLDSSSLPIYSYQNADFATLYGIEVDARKSLDLFGDEFNSQVRPYIGDLSNYYISANFSLTESEVNLRDDQIELLTTNKRQLQGLSKVVVNATFGYDDEDRSVTLSYNKMGERIRKVGVINEQGVRFGDTIEVPPALLDFVWSEKFWDGWSAKFKIGNILDSPTVWKKDEKEIKHFKTGQKFDFSISYKF